MNGMMCTYLQPRLIIIIVCEEKKMSVCRNGNRTLRPEVSGESKEYPLSFNNILNTHHAHDYINN